jgi:hypothetical protein
MGSPHLRPPSYLDSIQRGWWWNLFWAMFDAEPQGYLAVTSDFWLVAGSRDPQRWQVHSPAVTATFDTAEIAGTPVIFFAPLIDALAEQHKKLRARGLPRANENLPSLSQSVFDFDRKDQKEKNRADLFSKKPAAGSGCALHPNSGLTNWGSCWGCYAAKYG